MPIKPENKARYPKNWEEIRRQILTRDNNACKDCGVKNYTVGFRAENKEFHEYECGILGFAKAKEIAIEVGLRLIRIVLTISHNDHTPENCAPDNLAARCQRCHLLYDLDHHKNTRLKSRAKTLADNKQNSLIL